MEVVLHAVSEDQEDADRVGESYSADHGQLVKDLYIFEKRVHGACLRAAEPLLLK